MTDPRDDPHSLYNRGAHVGPIGKAEYREVPTASLRAAAERMGITIEPDGSASISVAALRRRTEEHVTRIALDKRRLTGPFSFDETAAFVKEEREKVLGEVETALRKLPSMATAEQLVPTYQGVTLESFMEKLRSRT